MKILLNFLKLAWLEVKFPKIVFFGFVRIRPDKLCQFVFNSVHLANSRFFCDYIFCSFRNIRRFHAPDAINVSEKMKIIVKTYTRKYEYYHGVLKTLWSLKFFLQYLLLRKQGSSAEERVSVKGKWLDWVVAMYTGIERRQFLHLYSSKINYLLLTLEIKVTCK